MLVDSYYIGVSGGLVASWFGLYILTCLVMSGFVRSRSFRSFLRLLRSMSVGSWEVVHVSPEMLPEVRFS